MGDVRKKKKTINMETKRLPTWSSGENLLVNAGDTRDVGLILAPGRSPGEGKGDPLQDSCLENSIDRGGPGGLPPWGLKESDTTEWLSINNTQQRLNDTLLNNQWIPEEVKEKRKTYLETNETECTMIQTYWKEQKHF